MPSVSWIVTDTSYVLRWRGASARSLTLLAVLLILGSVSHASADQGGAPAGMPDLAFVEFSISIDGDQLYGRFACISGENCVVSFADKIVSFFPLQSGVGITVRAEGGGKDVVNGRGAVHIFISAKDVADLVPLYSDLPDGTRQKVGELTVRIGEKGGQDPPP